MRGIKPLRSEPRVLETKPKPKPKARFTKADERQVLAESLEDDIDTIEHGHGAALRYCTRSTSASAPCANCNAAALACRRKSTCTA